MHILDRQRGTNLTHTSLDIEERSMMQELLAADLDGDGAPEIVIGLWWIGQRVLWNDGKGAFARRSQLETCASSLVSGFTVADIDGDGDRDLMAACDLDSEVGVALSDGRGGFTPAAPFYSDDKPAGVIVADFDGRCGVDLAVLNGSLDGNLWVYSRAPLRAGP